MTDPLSITLAAITLGSALKDLTELALKLHGSFKKHAHNMRVAESLTADTLEIVQDIEKFYIAHGAVLDNLPDIRDAVARFSNDMQSVYDQCLPILRLGSSPESGLRKTLLKIEMWRSRKEVESKIRNLREQANMCYRRFTRHTQLGTVVAIGELKDAVSEGFSSAARQLSALKVSDENMIAFMGSIASVLSTLPSSVILSEDLVFTLYIRGHVGKIDDILKNLVSKQLFTVEAPDHNHAQPFAIQSSFPRRTPRAIEYVRGNTVTELVRLQQGLLNREAGGTPLQEGAWALHDLSLDLYRLRMYSESLILCTWSADLYRTLSISDRDVYAPPLAMAFFYLALLYYTTGDFAQAIAITTECLSLLKTCAPTFATEALTARMLSESAHFRRAIGEHSFASLQDAEDSVAMWERLGADEMFVIGSVPPGTYPNFGIMRLGIQDSVVHGYALALDAQRTYLYASQKYQAALDVGKKALRLFRSLAQCYEHVEIQSQVATLCQFLCDDVFRDVIPLSSALIYAQEAVQIWEDVNRVTRTKEACILNTIAMQTKILVEMGRPNEALTVFHKLARRVRFMSTNQRMYIHRLQDLASSLFDGMYYVEAATASRIIIGICHQGPDCLPISQRFMIDILLNHIESCYYANYLSEALLCSEEALAIAGQQRKEDTAFTQQYLACVYWADYLSLEAGYPDRALNQCQEALNIASPFSRYDSIRLDLIASKALAFLRLGQLSLAAATITEAYHLTDSTTLNLQEEGLYGKLLFTSALVHRCSGKQDDALTTIKAAIPIFKSMNWDTRLYLLSDVQADMGYDADSLSTAEEIVKSMEQRASLPPSIAYWYRESQYSLCLRLFLTGDFTRALQLILEVRAFYEWHAHSRNVWFINLARALRAEGILECASDRHAEGAAARTRLNELQQRLQATFPGLASQVDVALDYERNFFAWKRLLEKYPLSCSHWVEDGVIGTGQEYTITHSHPTTSV
ncbi:hypothetical protein D9613_010442 [Agrocybe pediades]|uniref:Uncharacterized protein n=1 Tax=Agrocybe pediades TaxID=84607 RepID=A0A8H4VI25_9AGAR|nr:hypothetical protein D9613_010442 [Agrocybe pediades]